MFDNLSGRLEGIFKKLRGHGKLNENNIKEALREVRLALLEADVNFKVVKDFVERVRLRAVGQEVMESLTPGQQLVKVVRDELTNLMGGGESKIQFSTKPPTIILLVGLQGSGKTTTAAKLAKKLHEEGRTPMLVPADPRRPAATEQLTILGREVNVGVYQPGGEKNAVKICAQARDEAYRQNSDVLIIDTAGRLHIDQELMKELSAIHEVLESHENLLVVDAMTGQDAVNVAQQFNNTIRIDGVILTKLDGDARGGAALSIKETIGKPIKFVGIGEKLDQFEIFHPDRMASRILGMGDILSLVEKAEAAYTEEKASELQRKLLEDSFTLEDFKEQLLQIKKMGPLDQLLEMMPGFKSLKGVSVDERELKKVEAIINSMTPIERRNHAIISGSRRKRIARGSGTTVQDVNRLLKQFVQTRKMMKAFTKGGKRKPANMGRGFFAN